MSRKDLDGGFDTTFRFGDCLVALETMWEDRLSTHCVLEVMGELDTGHGRVVYVTKKLNSGYAINVDAVADSLSLDENMMDDTISMLGEGQRHVGSILPDGGFSTRSKSI